MNYNGVGVGDHAITPGALIAQFVDMTIKHRFAHDVKTNQVIIDAISKLYVKYLMCFPKSCFEFIIYELCASSKARRENNRMQYLYWIYLSYKMIVVIMKRLQEFPPEVQTEFGQILEFGHGCCVNQGANAVKAYEAAAEQGYTLAGIHVSQEKCCGKK